MWKTAGAIGRSGKSGFGMMQHYISTPIYPQADVIIAWRFRPELRTLKRQGIQVYMEPGVFRNRLMLRHLTTTLAKPATQA